MEGGDVWWDCDDASAIFLSNGQLFVDFNLRPSEVLIRVPRRAETARGAPGVSIFLGDY